MSDKPLDKPKDEDRSTEKAAVTLPGTVEKIVPPVVPSQSEKAQISVEGAEELYREIRVENALEDEAGNTVSLKEGAEVEITIEADPAATTLQKQPSPKGPVQPTSVQKARKPAD